MEMQVNIALLDQCHYASYTIITYILTEFSNYLLYYYAFWFLMQLYEIHILNNTLNITPADHLVISKNNINCVSIYIILAI